MCGKETSLIDYTTYMVGAKLEHCGRLFAAGGSLHFVMEMVPHLDEHPTLLTATVSDCHDVVFTIILYG